MLDKTKTMTTNLKVSILPKDKEEAVLLAEQEDISLSELVRRALKSYIKKEQHSSDATSISYQKLYWRQASTELSRTELMIYLLMQEEGTTELSPSQIEKMGLMSKGTASKAIKQLHEKKYIDENGQLIKKEYPQSYKQHSIRKDNNSYSVYKLTFPNNKIYIGLTCGSPDSRWSNGEGYIHNKEMYSDILKYTWEKVQKDIIQNNLTWSEADHLETQLIQIYSQHHKLYNKAKNSQ